MRRSIAAAIAACLFLATCKTAAGPGEGEVVVALAAHAGAGQTGTVAAPLATNPAVRLTVNGDPVAGQTVTFAVTGGGGSATGATPTTSTDGVATVGSWVLGATVGANTLTATVSHEGQSKTVTFTASGTAGPPAELTKQAGDGGSGVAGQAPATLPAVLVEDAHGNPAAGVTVTFAVTSGGGTVTGETPATGADGVATVGGWILGTTVGDNTLTATAAGAGIAGNPALFTATATVGPPAILTKTDGDTQTAGVSTGVAVAPSVKLTDVNANPVAGATITFAVASGGGVATGTTPTTGADGLASVGSWTLGPTAGENTLTATAAGTGITGNPATFTADGTADLVPAALAKVEGDGQVAIAGQAVAVAPAVLVTAANGDPVPNVTVDFTVTGGGGTTPAPPLGGAARPAGALGVQAVTDATGVARAPGWTLGTLGANTLVATASGEGISGNPATFTATGALDPVAFVGDWTGTWNDTTFGSTGAVAMTISVTNPNAAPAGAARIPGDGTPKLHAFIDFDGNVLGLGDPTPMLFDMKLGSQGGTLQPSTGTVFGDNLTTSVTPLGTISGTALTPAPGIARLDYTGTVTPTNITTSYTITFVGGTTAVGTWTMTKDYTPPGSTHPASFDGSV